MSLSSEYLKLNLVHVSEHVVRMGEKAIMVKCSVEVSVTKIVFKNMLFLRATKPKQT